MINTKPFGVNLKLEQEYKNRETASVEATNEDVQTNITLLTVYFAGMVDFR